MCGAEMRAWSACKLFLVGSQNFSFVLSHKDLGVIVDTSLRFHTHVGIIVNKASGLSTNLLCSTLCRTRGFMLTLFTSHIRPLLEYSSYI